MTEDIDMDGSTGFIIEFMCQNCGRHYHSLRRDGEQVTCELDRGSPSRWQIYVNKERITFKCKCGATDNFWICDRHPNQGEMKMKIDTKEVKGII